MKNKKKIKVIIIVFLIVIFVSSIALYSGLTVKHYSLVSEKVNEPARIVLLTDLHNHIYGKNQDVLIKKIIDQKPDMVFLVGDIADDWVTNIIR